MELKLWQRAGNYMGQEYNDYYVVLAQTRDSDILEQSNFEAATKLLGGEKEPEVIIVLSGHWLCGWVEFIGIHKDATDKIAIAEKILDDLENYSVLDDDDYSNREYEAIINNIKDSLYKISFLDNIPEPAKFYSYFFNTEEDMTEKFYPTKDMLFEAIEEIYKTETRQQQRLAGQVEMEV